jgi:predicted RNase H-like HicB family nuclease
MKTFTAVIERDSATGFLVGYMPGFPGAHSQAETMDELHENLREVIAMLLEDGEPLLEAEFVGIKTSRSPDHGLASRSQIRPSLSPSRTMRVRRSPSAWLDGARQFPFTKAAILRSHWSGKSPAISE